MEKTTEIRSLMTKLQSELDSVQADVDRLEKMKNSLQEFCQHDWQPTGNNDSHYDEYQCTICDKKDLR